MMTTSKEAAAKFDKRDFRSVMGLFATGVSVVTTQLNGETHAMTANALTSVSLEPMLVLVCVQKNAHMAQFLRESGEFAINILNEDQADLSNYFAGIWPDDKPAPTFEFESWVCGPRLSNTIGALACKGSEFLEGGDHWIITAEVVDLYRQQMARNPLLFYTGKYRKVLDE